MVALIPYAGKAKETGCVQDLTWDYTPGVMSAASDSVVHHGDVPGVDTYTCHAPLNLEVGPVSEWAYMTVPTSYGHHRTKPVTWVR